MHVAERLTARLRHETLDARVAAREAVVVDHVLLDRNRRPPEALLYRVGQSRTEPPNAHHIGNANGEQDAAGAADRLHHRR